MNELTANATMVDVQPWTYERLTSGGRSAVAVWSLCGIQPDHHNELVRLGLPVSQPQQNRLRLVAVGPDPSEDCVFVSHGDGHFELQTHGGSAVSERIMKLLNNAGGKPRPSYRFDDECWRAVALATTAKVAVHLAQLADGRLRNHLEQIRHFGQANMLTALQSLLANTQAARPLLEGFRVAIVGRPNAGKSSLMNQLAGYARSLTDPRPGATRDVVSLATAFGGYPAELSDTAGMRKSDDAIEQIGVARAEHVASGADVVVLVIDSSQPVDDETSKLIMQFPDALVIAHKSDLGDKSGIAWPDEALTASSTTGEGIAALKSTLAARIAERALSEEALFLCSARQADSARSIVEAVAQKESTADLWDQLLA